MFPFEQEIEEQKVIPHEYEVDPITGELTGRVVSGIEAIKTWVHMVLNTERYRYLIYSWDYGHELDTLIGGKYTQEYIETEAYSMISECLLIHPHIESISNLTATTDGDKLSVSFTVNTTFGGFETNV